MVLFPIILPVRMVLRRAARFLLRTASHEPLDRRALTVMVFTQPAQIPHAVVVFVALVVGVSPGPGAPTTGR